MANNDAIYDAALTKVLSQEVEPGIRKYIQNLVKKKSFTTRQITGFLNKATKLLQELRKSQESYQGEHWSLREWAANQAKGYEATYAILTKTLLQGYYIMEKVRESIVHEEIDYTIGIINIDENKDLIPEQSGQLHLTLDQFLYLFAMGRSSGEFPALKAVGATGRISTVFEKAVRDQSSAYVPFKPALFNDLIARIATSQLEMNYGQIYEAYYTFEQQSSKGIWFYSQSEFEKICNDAKNSTPGYQGGDYGSTQLKAMINGSGFSIMKLQTIVAVLKDYVAIEKLILKSADAAVLQPILQEYLFTPMKKEDLKKKIKSALGEVAWKKARKEVNEMLKTLFTSDGKVTLMLNSE